MILTLFKKCLLCFSCAAVLSGLLPALPGSAVNELVEIHRIVIIGDVHGDAENFLKALRIADLVEGSENEVVDIFTNPPQWKFSQPPNGSVTMRTTLVQMGDLVDRGEQDFESLNIAIALQEQTGQTSTLDKVVILIGNHELLNIQGNYHYVNKRNYGGFMSRSLRLEAMNANGAFGKYIIDNFKAAHFDESTLFVHAGFETDMTIPDIDTLNTEVREALRTNNYRHPYLRSNGPLWTRKMIMESMTDNCDQVAEILQRFNAKRVVVGHTPQQTGQIEQYCGGRVIAADVGMSRWMYNTIAALEMVFLTYFDSELQQATSRYIFRELRDGSPAFAATSVEHVNGEKKNAKICRYVDDIDDL